MNSIFTQEPLTHELKWQPLFDAPTRPLRIRPGPTANSIYLIGCNASVYLVSPFSSSANVYTSQGYRFDKVISTGGTPTDIVYFPTTAVTASTEEAVSAVNQGMADESLAYITPLELSCETVVVTDRSWNNLITNASDSSDQMTAQGQGSVPGIPESNEGASNQNISKLQAKLNSSKGFTCLISDDSDFKISSPSSIALVDNTLMFSDSVGVCSIDSEGALHRHICQPNISALVSPKISSGSMISSTGLYITCSGENNIKLLRRGCPLTIFSSGFYGALRLLDMCEGPQRSLIVTAEGLEKSGPHYIYVVSAYGMPSACIAVPGIANSVCMFGDRICISIVGSNTIFAASIADLS